MEEQEVTIFDFERMFLGDLSVLFTLEVVFRTIVMFVYTVALVRLLGKRGMRQLTPLELVIIIALGSAVGDPMLYDDVPLLHGMAVVTVIVILELTLARATGRSQRLERMIESGPTRVVYNGRIDVEAAARESVGIDELMTGLREAGYDNLGDVERAYLESSGQISVFPARGEHPAAGLSLFPEDLQGDESGSAPATGLLACVRCGAIESGGNVEHCDSCGPGSRHVPAVRRRTREAGPA